MPVQTTEHATPSIRSPHPMPVLIKRKGTRTKDEPVSTSAVERQHLKKTKKGSVGFVPELESIRGIAALMVAAAHASNSLTGSHVRLFHDPRSWTNPLWNPLLWVFGALNNSAGAVNLFFVLSGFVLASSIQRGHQSPGAAARHFLTGRIFRLYPAIVVTVLVFCIIFWLTGAMVPAKVPATYSAGSILRNLLLIDRNIDGVMWSLQVEALAIPLIFLVTIGQQRWGAKFTVPVGALLLAFSICRPYRYLVAHGAFVTFFYAFVFGIGTHLIAPGLLQRVNRKRLPWILAALLILFFVPRPLLGFMSRWARLAECASAAGLIAILVHGPAIRLKQVLNWPLFRFYGRISYSFYLLHPLTFLVIWRIPGPLSRLLDAGIPGLLLAIALTSASIVATTPLAWLNWRFVELPGIAAGRRIWPQRRNASPYVGPQGRVLHATTPELSPYRRIQTDPHRYLLRCPTKTCILEAGPF